MLHLSPSLRRSLCALRVGSASTSSVDPLSSLPADSPDREDQGSTASAEEPMRSLQRSPRSGGWRPWLRLLRALHRLMGTLLSALMLMWFVSGMVMMYHDFPRVGDKELPHLSDLSPSSIDSIGGLATAVRAALGVSTEVPLRSLSIEQLRERPIYRLRHADGELLLDAHTLQPVRSETTQAEARAIAETWADSIVSERVVTLPETFVPTAYYQRHMPLYYYELSDPQHTSIYVSSQSGRVVQATTRTERLWSYVGSIPHYLYWAPLRQHQQAWISVVTWLGSLSLLLCLSGLVISVAVTLQGYRRAHRLTVPYRRPRYLRWHHIIGLCFGVVMCAFVLSGVYSLHQLPQWLIGKPDRSTAQSLRSTVSYPSEMQMHALQGMMAQGGIKAIELMSWGDIPYYRVATEQGWHHVTVGEDGAVVPLLLTEEQIRSLLSERLPYLYEVEELHHYDGTYTRSKRGGRELPVYRVTVSDPARTLLFVSPTTGYISSTSQADRRARILYPQLHSYHFAFLDNHPPLREVVVWILLLGGTIVSATGVVLGCRSIGRYCRRRCRR